MRVILGIVIVSIIFLFKIFGVVNFNIDHIHDLVQEWTGPINRELNNNPPLAHAIEIIASLMMDFSFLSLCVYWAAFGKNSIPIMASGNFYITRAILQVIVNSNLSFFSECRSLMESTGPTPASRASWYRMAKLLISSTPGMLAS